MKQLIRYLIWFLLLFAGYNSQAQNNTVYGAGISYTNGAPAWTPNPRTSRAAVDTVTGRWYHFNTPGGWQWIGNTVEEIAGCAAPAYTPSKGDSRLVINNCVKPEVYWYDGAAWIWINQGEVYTAGQGIRIENNSIILDSLYVLRFRTGSNTDGAAGTMSWNTTEETVDLVTDQGAVTGHLMESAYYNTRNTTGTPITIGTVVMANGTTGNTGRILIAPAIADGSVNSEYILGLAAQTIGNNSNGKVQHFGKIRGIQTNGANYGETWVDGDVLYCSSVTPGYLTKVLPTAPNLKVPIAIVIHAHPTDGTLFVRPSHFPDLAQINDVQLSSPTNGQVLTYNSTLSRWENATPANQLQTLSTDGSAGNISISSGNTITLNVNDADASATNELQTLSTGTNTLTLSNGGGTVTVDTNPADDVTGSGTSGQVSFWTGTSTQSGDANLFWDNINKRLALGSNAPREQLDLSGNIYFRQNTTTQVSKIAIGESGGVNRRAFWEYWTGSTAASNGMMLAKPFENSGTATSPVYTSRNSAILPIGLRIVGNNFDIIGSSTAITNGTTFTPTVYFRADIVNSRIGINTLSPLATLHVVGSGTSSSTWTAQFHNSAGNNNALMIRDDGRVAVGFAAPLANFHVSTGSGGSLFIGGGGGGHEFRINSFSFTNDVVGTAGRLHFSNGSIGVMSFPTGNTSGIIINPTSTTQTTTSAVLISTGRAITNGDIFRVETNRTITGNAVTSAAFNFTGARNLDATNNLIGSTYTDLYFGGAFSPYNATNNISYNGIQFEPTINQTNGTNAVVRGILINPTITSAPNFRAVEYANSVGWGIYASGTAKSYFAGNVAIGTTAQNASAAFEVASTTQGILFPRMTTTERNAIATPANGLVIYNTTDNKLQVRAGGAWVDLH